ncbi:hypothetical protein LMG28138_05686 [Pararobbsia alpina]|uniref:Phasin domain-containing protein n=1 Tax=Pararobbsia alpina TaxID=621374 RepID=A0A6S7BM40_9BURK|nr:hypothetical protein LMG28138_05686 [Pararobbsia alpina]
MTSCLTLSIRATEVDILNETRSYYEQYGIDVKSVLESALRQSQSALQEPTEHVSNLIAASTDAPNEAAASALDANAQKMTNTSALAAEGERKASEAARRPAKAGSKH